MAMSGGRLADVPTILNQTSIQMCAWCVPLVDYKMAAYRIVITLAYRVDM
jgi:hypothetical protein